MKKSRTTAVILALATVFASVFALASCRKEVTVAETTAAETTSAKNVAAITDVPTTDVDFEPNVTKPEKPAETVTEAIDRVNEHATNPDTGKQQTEIKNVEFVYPEYFAQGNSYVSIVDIAIEDTGFTHNADAYVDFKVLARGDGEDEKAVKVSYVGYGANGEITRRSQITVRLYGKNVGDIIENCRMDFKRETVKIVFTEFKEITE